MHALGATGYSPDYRMETHGPTFEALQREIRQRGLLATLPMAGEEQATLHASPPEPATRAEHALRSFSLALGAAGLVFGLTRWFDQRHRERWQIRGAAAG